MKKIRMNGGILKFGLNRQVPIGADSPAKNIQLHT